MKDVRGVHVDIKGAITSETATGSGDRGRLMFGYHEQLRIHMLEREGTGVKHEIGPATTTHNSSDDTHASVYGYINLFPSESHTEECHRRGLGRAHIVDNLEQGRTPSSTDVHKIMKTYAADHGQKGTIANRQRVKFSLLTALRKT